jgi:short-subunit dehydrogenase
MKMNLKNKNCIVTGATSGIGKSLTKYLLDEEANVFGIGLEKDSIEFTHHSLTMCYSDLSDIDQVIQTFHKAIEVLKHIDIYIANAGQARYGLSESMSKTDFDLLLNLNFISVVEALNLMKKNHEDLPFTFLATSSVMADWPLPGYATYAATKAALATYIKGYRHEIAKGQNLLIAYPVATSTNFFKVSGQKHKSWVIQTPEHVAKSMIKGIKRNKKNIYPSKIFHIIYKVAPRFLNSYLRREKKLLMKK